MHVEYMHSKYKSLPKVSFYLTLISEFKERKFEMSSAYDILTLYSFIVSLYVCKCEGDVYVCASMCIFVVACRYRELMWWSEHNLVPLFETVLTVVHCCGVRLDGPIALWILLSLPPISL